MLPRNRQRCKNCRYKIQAIGVGLAQILATTNRRDSQCGLCRWFPSFNPNICPAIQQTDKPETYDATFAIASLQVSSLRLVKKMLDFDSGLVIFRVVSGTSSPIETRVQSTVATYFTIRFSFFRIETLLKVAPYEKIGKAE